MLIALQNCSNFDSGDLSGANLKQPSHDWGCHTDMVQVSCTARENVISQKTHEICLLQKQTGKGNCSHFIPQTTDLQQCFHRFSESRILIFLFLIKIKILILHFCTSWVLIVRKKATKANFFWLFFLFILQIKTLFELKHESSLNVPATIEKKSECRVYQRKLDKITNSLI